MCDASDSALSLLVNQPESLSSSKDEMKAKKRITQQEYDAMLQHFARQRGNMPFNLDSLDLREVKIKWNSFSSISLSGSILSGVSLKNYDISYINFSGAILDGPELFDVIAAYSCTFSEKLIPWLSVHPHFIYWYDSLTFINEETGAVVKEARQQREWEPSPTFDEL